jgi:hypothetical protein
MMAARVHSSHPLERRQCLILIQVETLATVDVETRLKLQ